MLSVKAVFCQSHVHARKVWGGQPCYIRKKKATTQWRSQVSDVWVWSWRTTSCCIFVETEKERDSPPYLQLPCLEKPGTLACQVVQKTVEARREGVSFLSVTGGGAFFSTHLKPRTKPGSRTHQTFDVNADMKPWNPNAKHTQRNTNVSKTLPAEQSAVNLVGWRLAFWGRPSGW